MAKRKRPETEDEGPALPAALARIMAAGEEIIGEPDPESLKFLYTVLAQVSLPYRDPGEPEWRRQSGRASMLLTAGKLYDPKLGDWREVGLPYGAKPRLLLLHACTEAVQSGSPEIAIGDSMTAFMRDLGLQVTGGKQGTLTRFKDQLNRLVAATIRIAFTDERQANRVRLHQPAPLFREIDLWFPDDPGQQVFWPSRVRLSDEFFENLKDHALPLDPRAVRALQHSARALDLYSWLAYRLPRVKGPNGEPVSWRALHSQFGGTEKGQGAFRREFIHALRSAMSVYPDARIDETDDGVRLYQSRPAISFEGRGKGRRGA